MTNTAGQPLPAPRQIPGKGNLYTVKTSNGSFNLRDYASSSHQTGPVWTIDIPASISKTRKNVEIKFVR